MKHCSMPDCTSPMLARQLCRKHYLRWYKHGDPTIIKDTLGGVKKAAVINRKHGLWKHPLYSTWSSMMARCYKPTNAKYHRYGARGIVVCDSWHDVANFISDMAQKPSATSLDRIDNDGPYSKENCRWATRITQARNRQQCKLTDEQRSLIFAMYKSIKSPKFIAEKLGLKPHDVKNTVYKN